MTAFWTFAVVVVTLAASMCTALLAPMRQRRLKVDGQYFRRVKVRYLYFLFGSMGTKQEGRDVRSYGVILPMFVLHIIGYILTVGIWAAVPVLYRYGVDLEYLWAVPLAVDLVYTLTLTVTEAVCVRVSARRAAADGK